MAEVPACLPTGRFDPGSGYQGSLEKSRLFYLTTMYYVYAITSLSRNYTYIGLTNDPDRRFHQHNQGYNRTTKPYSPFKLILLESFPSREMAREREKHLKTGVGREFLKNIINGGGAGLSTDR